MGIMDVIMPFGVLSLAYILLFLADRSQEPILPHEKANRNSSS